MKSEEKILKNSANQDDRMQVLLALAVQEEKPAEPCPSDEQLAAFIDGRLNTNEHEDILKHLNACSPCYRQWSDISSVLEGEQEPEPGLDHSLGYPGPVGLPNPADCKSRPGQVGPNDDQAPEPLSRICIWERAAAGFAFAVAACLVLFLNFYIPPVENLIAESYKTAFTQEMTFRHDNLGKVLSFPWEKSGQAYGFSPSGQPDPGSRAFGSGLWSGSQELPKLKKTTPMPDFLSSKWKDETGTKANNWSETPWAHYFSMGQWCFLLRAVCMSDTDILPAFWDQQNLILKQIQKHFEKNGEDARIVSQRLGNIKSVLEKLNRNSPGKKQRRKIASELAMLIEYLSPQRIPED